MSANMARLEGATTSAKECDIRLSQEPLPCTKAQQCKRTCPSRNLWSCALCKTRATLASRSSPKNSALQGVLRPLALGFLQQVALLRLPSALLAAPALEVFPDEGTLQLRVDAASSIPRRFSRAAAMRVPM